MVKLYEEGVLLSQKGEILQVGASKHKELCKNTMTYKILKAHNTSDDMENLKLKFDSLVSPDNNYVSILQTASASGVKKFPIPYVLSNCHNTLCAVGGTINEDDHVFGLDNVKKYGGIFIPPYKAVLHQYMREMMAGCGKMILGSDSHTRYGALGTLSIGEGGGEIAKQLLNQTYDIVMPKIIGVVLKGIPRNGIGPQDIALAIIGKTFKNNFNKNKVLEFVGTGVNNLSVEYRMGIDVMTTESGALSSIWCTDDKVKEYLALHGRESEYFELLPEENVYYDGMIEVDLSRIECMMALPYHPSNVVTISEFKKNPKKYLLEIEEEGQKIKGDTSEKFSIIDKLKDGELYVDQALVSGCSGGLYENICAMNDILKESTVSGVSLGINPASQPILTAIMNNGVAGSLTSIGATLRPCICGPCFGVTDVPANNQLSIRHVTRNYPNREGSKSSKGQMAACIIMDARSIAATVRNGGKITAATEIDVEYSGLEYKYDTNYYNKQVQDYFGKSDNSVEVRKGPNIEDWPEIDKIKQHLLLRVSRAYSGSVTTDDLSPSGDAVAYRSNPLKLAEFTMINKDKDYVGLARAIKKQGDLHRDGKDFEDKIFEKVVNFVTGDLVCDKNDITIGSVIVSNQIGDGSSREQACSSQRILGGYANIANEFATKRYRSNLLNWGMLPITSEDISKLKDGDFILIENVEDKISQCNKHFEMKVIGDSNYEITGTIGNMTEIEKDILLSGCLINYNKNKLVRSL